MSASTNLFDARASWPFPPTDTPAVVKMEKTEVPPRVAAIPYTLVMNKPQNNRPAEDECTWGPHCPICAKEEGTEDQNSDRQENQQRTPKALDIPKPMTFQIGFPNRSNWRAHGMRGWNILMKKYNLDYYSSSESDSDF